MDVLIAAKRGYGDRHGNLHPQGTRVSFDDHLALKLIRYAIATPAPPIVGKPAKAKAEKPAPTVKHARKSMTKQTFIGKEGDDG